MDDVVHTDLTYCACGQTQVVDHSPEECQQTRYVINTTVWRYESG